MEAAKATPFKRFRPYLPIRAIYGTSEPFTGLGGGVRLFLSSTWGRADQQTSRDSFESGAFCFAVKTAFHRLSLNSAGSVLPLDSNSALLGYHSMFRWW